MRRPLIVTAMALAALSLAATATAAPIARPNPVFVSVHLDYVNPLRTASGAIATLTPLDHAVIAQAVADQTSLATQLTSTQGGFSTAGSAQSSISSGGHVGHNMVGQLSTHAEIPTFGQAAGGKVKVFAFAGATPTTPSDQGSQPVPGLGVPPPVTPPTNTNTVPPPNQGFGGSGTTGGQSTTTTSTAETTTTTPTTTPPATTSTTTPATSTTTTTSSTTTTKPETTTTETTTTTKPTTTTNPVTTTVATTTTTPPPTIPPPTTTTQAPPTVTGGGSCGVAGLTINSDHSTCALQVENMAPGGSASEVITLTNDSGQPFTLSLEASGTQNQLWHDLEMGVWEQGTAAPAPLPALLLWTTQFNTLVTLAAGASISYEIELYLPTTAGNNDQGLAASIDLTWRAQG
jgi:hypothetical protein